MKNSPIQLDSKREPEAQAPHLSYSRLEKYLQCPEKYRLYYIEGLRPRVPAASLAFGQTMHQALAQYFQAHMDPVVCFQENWKLLQDEELMYAHRDTWASLAAKGHGLLEKFMQEDVQLIGNVQASEKPFELKLSNLDLPFVGVIDLIADVFEKRTVVDFKTAAADYEPHEADLSDQLTAYKMAEPDAEQLAFCVLIKTKEPRIEWHVSRRGNNQLLEFLGKAKLISHEIARRAFYKRVGKHCSWCEFLPICMKHK
jgi:RecB family exonuclease